MIQFGFIQNSMTRMPYEKSLENQYNNHFKYVYYTKTDKKISDFVLQEEELSEVKYITIEELQKINNSHNKEYVFENSEYVEKSLELLKQIL